MQRPASFKQSDVKRAVSAVQKAGIKIGRVDLDPATGKFSIVPAEATTDSSRDLDRWLEKDNEN